MFLNDLENFLLRGNNFGLNTFDNSLQCYLKLFSLLYADDMVLYAESIEELQDLLDKFHIYCSQCKVNHEKTKVVIFGEKSKHPSLIKFNDQPLDVVDCFKYLGVVLPNLRRFFIRPKSMMLSRQGKHCCVYIEK